MSIVEHEADLRRAMKSPAIRAGRSNLVLGLWLAGLVFLYAFVFLLKPDQLFADDSYFYFQVAWNFARGMGSTFNTVMPTNGYHPLWMLICAAIYKIYPSRLHGVYAIATVIVLLNLLTMATVRQILVRTGSNLWPISFTLLIPFLFLSQLGTEGALSGWVLALMMLAAYRFLLAPGGQTAVWFHLAAALAVLSRLDNIFLVALVWLSISHTLGRRWWFLQIRTLPIYAVLWGCYLATNQIYFHTWQPISGLLKSKSTADQAFGSNVPHTGLLALALIVVAIGIRFATGRRDLFFRKIELPFAAGVLLHGLYIVLRMSDETRWSWYYTSWVLLASVMLGRSAAVLLERRKQWTLPLSALCLLLLTIIWVRDSWFNTYKIRDARTPASFNEMVYQKMGVHRALAYDQPGRLAYYSDVEIIPLDGLMGNLQFQQDLGTMGIEEYTRVHHIDGFIGPAEPFDQAQYKAMCLRVNLSSTQFHCRPSSEEPGRYETSAVDVYSRVPAASAGTLRLDTGSVIWTEKGYVSVWKLSPR